MTADLNKIFVEKGIYQLKQVRDNDSLFLCEAVNGNDIGKLVVFKKISDRLFKRTNVGYFLNAYMRGDIKELFIRRDNYDMVGMINDNYKFNEDKEYLVNCNII
jgi:hypothetical protein